MNSHILVHKSANLNHPLLENFAQSHGHTLRMLTNERVLIISSMAGLGNHSVALTIQNILKSDCITNLIPIENLISQNLRQRHFERHKILTKNFPHLLRHTNRLKIWRQQKNLSDFKTANKDFKKLIESSKDFKTIICTNMKAAFWLSKLKQQDLISKNLIIIVFNTDLTFSHSANETIWNEITALFSPYKPKNFEERICQFHLAPIPISADFFNINQKNSAKDILICGGGWGLGNYLTPINDILTISPSCKIHIVCGSNEKLQQQLAKKFPTAQIKTYGSVPNMPKLIEQSFLIISKPGALTIIESLASGRELLLTKEISDVECKNKNFAIQHLGAKEYSRDNLQKCILANINN